MQYSSALSRWHTTSAIRQFRYEDIINDGIQGHLPFSPSLVPISGHPLVKEKGVQEKILYRCMTEYMLFTTYLEILLINPSLTFLIFGDHNFNLDDCIYTDAMKIYCDEGYHALFSLETFTHVDIPYYKGIREIKKPNSIQRVFNIINNLDKTRRGVALLSFAMVSETMVTNSLLSAMKDETVAASVRSIISAHAEDEGKHQAFFMRVYPLIWHQLPENEKNELGSIFRNFAESFVEPDWDFYSAVLQESSFDKAEVNLIISDVKSTFNLDLAVNSATPATRKVLKNCEHELLKKWERL